MSTIRADMQLNAAPFLAGIARVQSSMRNIQAAAAGLTGAFFAVRSVMASLSGVFQGMKGALDLGGKFSDLSASTGASVGELVMLSQAFQNAGMGADAVGPMIARFQKALAGVNEEGQSTAGALQKLGMNTLALNRMSVAAQFQELSRAFSSIKDPAERTRRAMELFGRSGAQMLALFRDPEAFTRAAAEVGTMGDALEANAGKFDSMSDALTTIGGKLDQFFVGLMSGTTGTDVLERAAKIDFTPMGQAAGGVGSSLKSWLPSLDTIEKWGTRVSPMFAQILGSVKGIMIPKMADSAANNIDKRTKDTTETFDAKLRSVTSEDERGAVMEELSAAIENARAKLGTLDTALAAIPPEDRAKIADALQRQVAAYEAQRNVLSQITPEVMAANAAEADRAAALAKSAAEAAKLAAQLDKALEARDAEIEKRIITELPSEQAQQRVLDQVSAPDKQAELVLGVSGFESLGAAKSALDALSQKRQAELQLNAVGLPSAEEMIRMVDAFTGKTVNLALEATGLPDATALRAAIENSDSKIINLALEATGLPNVGALRAALDGVSDKTITMALRATDSANIDELQAKLMAVPDETTATLIMRALGVDDIEAAKAKLAALQNGTADITLTSEGVTAEIERLRGLGADATDAEKARLMQLIEAEKTLLEIKGRQNAEDEKRAEHAAKLSQLMGDLALDADKALAQAAGDAERVKEIDTKKAANELQRRFESEGMDSAEAAKLARAKAAADAANQEAGNVAQMQPQQGDAQRSIGLGGSAGLGPSIDVQKEIVRKQADANKYLSELVGLIKSRTPVRLAEVFD